MKESPQFIKTTLLDVKRASSIVTQKVDKIAQELEQNVTEEQENKHSTKERIFYASVAYLQSTDDTTQLDELKDKGDYKGLLALAKELLRRQRYGRAAYIRFSPPEPGR